MEGVGRRLDQWGSVTLTGPPGVGKSRLAAKVANRIEAPGVPGVVVCVEGLSDPADVAPTMADALAAAESMGSRGEERPLVLLDDCDRALDACAEVVHRLVARGIRVLATAREPLGIEGESLWRVAPLAVPVVGGEEFPAVVTESEAVQLFCERAASVERDFALIPENASAIAEICRLLDGIPLAIELAARRVTVYPPAEILGRLSAPFSLLSSGPRIAHPRHQTLWASLAWSYDVLSTPEQVLLEGLGVFPGSFGVEAAAEVCAPDGMSEVEVAEILAALVDKSLVEVDSHAGVSRYRLLNVLRWFAVERLAAGGEEEAHRAEHARWCGRVVAAAGDPRRGRAWLDCLEPYHDDVHAALDSGLAGGAETTMLLSETDVQLCRAQGRYAEARQRVQQLAAASLPSGLRAPALAAAGRIEAAAGEIHRALAYLEEASILARGLAGATDSVRAEVWLASVRVAGCGRSALTGLEAATRNARKGGDPHLVVDALVELAHAGLLLGDRPQAHDQFIEASKLAQEHGDDVGQAKALVGLGCVAVALGGYGEAEGQLLQGLDMARALGEVEAAGLALVWLGEAARLQGKLDQAEARFAQALELANTAGHPHANAFGLLGLGRVAAQRGDATTAREMFQAALDAARTTSRGCLVAACLCGLAELTSDPLAAQSLVTEALRTAQRWGDWAGEALAFDHLARHSEVEGDVGGAIARRRHALGLRARIGDPAAVAASLDALAVLAAGRGQYAVAARLFGAAEARLDRYGCVRPIFGEDRRVSVIESVREALGDTAFDAECQHGARLSQKAAVACAATLGGERIPRPSTGWEALTKAERRVAELVARGETNAEIARNLSINAATVKAHLRSVYKKVAVDNRTALAAAMHGE